MLIWLITQSAGTVGLSDADDQLFVEGLPRPLHLHQLHSCTMDLVPNGMENVVVPLLQHQLVDEGLVDVPLHGCHRHFVAHGVLHHPEGQRQVVALLEEARPLADVGGQQASLIVVGQHALQTHTSADSQSGQ